MTCFVYKFSVLPLFLACNDGCYTVYTVFAINSKPKKWESYLEKSVKVLDHTDAKALYKALFQNVGQGSRFCSRRTKFDPEFSTTLYTKHWSKTNLNIKGDESED